MTFWGTSENRPLFSDATVHQPHYINLSFISIISLNSAGMVTAELWCFSRVVFLPHCLCLFSTCGSVNVPFLVCVKHVKRFKKTLIPHSYAERLCWWEVADVLGRCFWMFRCLALGQMEMKNRFAFSQYYRPQGIIDLGSSPHEGSTVQGNLNKSHRNSAVFAQ